MADLITEDMGTNSMNTEAVQNNSLTFDEKVIKKIVGFSTNEIPGVLAMSGSFIAGLTDKLRNSDDPTKGISVEMGNQQVSINMKVICEFGRNMPAIFEDIVERINRAIKEMTGLEVAEVKVHVSDILTKEDFERQNKGKAEEKIEMDQGESAEHQDTLEERDCTQ